MTDQQPPRYWFRDLTQEEQNKVYQYMFTEDFQTCANAYISDDGWLSFSRGTTLGSMRLFRVRLSEVIGGD